MKFTGHNVQVSPRAVLGKNVRIGDNTVIYDNVEIGDDSIITNDCIIGEPCADYYWDKSYKNPKTTIGKKALVRSHTIIYAGVKTGIYFETGHRITIREQTLIGNHCKVGTLSDLQGYLEIGDYCRLHSNVHLCQFSKLGNYVFVYPFTVLGNDKHPPTETVKGPELGDFSQIGVHTVIIGNVKIGINCVTGAQSTITQSFEENSLILGSPAKRISDVRELKSSDGNQLYPWQGRFSRGMPWAP
jgi:acetyltransferase-like isoleucine patch superfamily enzyme